MKIDTNGYNLKTSENTFKTAAYLTKKGAELKPVFDQVHNWADKWA